MEPFIGEIKIFAGNFAPKGWAFCDGQRLEIKYNPELFSILGTTYGGDGRITFALPDFRGRVPRGEGRGDGLSEVRLGENRGQESIVARSVQVAIPSSEEKSLNTFESATERTSILNPYIGINYIICLLGDYPKRN